MTDIAQLEVRIESRDATKARQEIDKLTASSRTVERELAKVSATFSGYGRQLGLAAAAGVTGVTALVKSSINAADAAGKAAQAAGLTVESYTELAFAAKLAGVEGQGLGVALTQLNRSIDGNRTAFADLGIKTTDASGKLKTADQILRELADRFQALPDGVSKSTAATQLFGETGTRLIPLLNQGAAGLDELSKEAQRLGVVVSTETAVAAERFNDDLTRLQTAVSGVGLRFASELLPSLTDASTYFARATAEAGLFEGSLISIGAALARVTGFDEVGQLASSARSQSAEIERLTNVMVGLDNVLQRDPGNEAALRRFENLRGKLFELQKEAAATTDRLKGLAAESVRSESARPPSLDTELARLRTAARPSARVSSAPTERSELFGPEIPESLTAALDRIASTDINKVRELREELLSLVSIKASGQGGAPVDEAILRVEAAIADLDPAQRAASESQRQLNALLADTPSARIAEAREQLDLLQEALSKTADPVQAQMIREAMAAITDSAGLLPKVNQELQRANGFAQQFGLTFSSALEDALVNFEDLRSTAQALAQDVIRIGIRNLVTEPFGQAITNLVSGSSGGVGGIVASAGSGTTALSPQVAALGTQAATSTASVAALASETAARSALLAAITAESGALAASLAAITSETAARTALAGVISGESAARATLLGAVTGETVAATTLTGALSATTVAASAAAAALQAAAASAAATGGGDLLGTLSSFGSAVFGAPSFAVGTNRVPRDMLAYIHKDEAIVPARYNPAAGGDAGSATAPRVVVNIVGGQQPAPKVEQRQDASGNLTIDVVYEQFVNRLNADTSNGRGIAPSVAGRFGANGGAGLKI